MRRSNTVTIPLSTPFLPSSTSPCMVTPLYGPSHPSGVRVDPVQNTETQKLTFSSLSLSFSLLSLLLSQVSPSTLRLGVQLLTLIHSLLGCWPPFLRSWGLFVPFHSLLPLPPCGPPDPPLNDFESFILAITSTPRLPTGSPFWRSLC